MSLDTLGDIILQYPGLYSHSMVFLDVDRQQER